MVDIQATLRGIKSELEQFGVSELYLFGSASHGVLRSDSDIDVVARFKTEDQEANRYFDVLFLLEDALGRCVDLALPDTLHPRIRERVLREMKRVA